MSTEPNTEKRTDEELPRPNLPLLRKVLDHIDAHPNEWYQSEWGIRTDSYPLTFIDGNAPACGTAFCIAGHAAVMSGATPVWGEEGNLSYIRPPGGGFADVQEFARKALGLTHDEASSLDGLFAAENDRDEIQRHAEAIAARAGERL